MRYALIMIINNSLLYLGIYVVVIKRKSKESDVNIAVIKGMCKKSNVDSKFFEEDFWPDNNS